MKCQILKIILILSLVYLLKADLPVHCKKSQIIGKWTFRATEPKPRSIQDLYANKCGHDLPSAEKSAHLSFSYLNVEKFSQSFEVEFTSDNALYNDKKGVWTMVYNEGFEFTFNDKTENYERYVAFSKYGPNSDNKFSSKWVSYCYETLVGWYNDGDKWGCFYGKKNVANADIPTNGEAGEQLKITEDSVPLKENNLKNKNKRESFLSFSKYSRFVETNNSDKFVVDANFKDHSKLVSRINAANLSWKAKNYEEFTGLSRGELKKMVGSLNIKDQSERRKKKKKLSRKSNTFENSDSNKSGSCPGDIKKPLICPVLNNKKNLKLEDLPENFDWGCFMNQARSQGSCGSCYTMATIAMIESRFRIHECENLLKMYGDLPDSNAEASLKLLQKFKISLDHVLKCSYYNQGCDGGYSFLVSKFFNEFEMYLDECFDGNSQSCYQTTCKDTGAFKDFKFTVTDYYYVGGSYGKTDAKSLKMELYKNGPIVVSFEPDNTMMSYSSGILDYDEETKKEMKKKNSIPKNGVLPEWQKVDHSVVLTGWGKETVNGKEVEYWKLLNSWGAGWGENGYFRLKAGEDLLCLESIGEAAIPLIIDSSNKSAKTR